MISGRSSETTYEQTENLNPGKTSSVTAAPPRTWRRSRTSTLRPARARYAAAVSPLCPPPITMRRISWTVNVRASTNIFRRNCGARRSHRSRMPIGTAVHARTFALCESLNYREWSGYYAVSAYEAHHEHEYNAIRNAAALIDVSPLFKYLDQRARRGQAGRSRHHARRLASWPSARSTTRRGATSTAR